MSKEELEKIVKRHVSELGEHFESVRIFVTTPSPDDSQLTRSYDSGCGNWYASYGHIQEWIIRQEEYTRLDARKSREESDE